MRTENKAAGAVFGASCLILFVYFGVIGAAIWAAVHFISKYW